jgi:hypothetical protein
MTKHLMYRRMSTFIIAGVLAVVGLALPALAGAPANDSIGAATPLGIPAKTFVRDTRQATATATDGRCVFGRSVWFRTRPGVTRVVRFSTLGSDYDTVLAVFRGSRDNRTLIACADDSFESAASARQVRLVAGNSYWVAVSACCSRSGAQGGRLVLKTFLPSAAGVSVAVGSVETGAVSGRLIVHGTMQCNTPSEVSFSLSASQRVAAGLNVASGEGFSFDICGPAAKPWAVTVNSLTGWAFQTGNVSISLSAFAFDGFQEASFGPLTDNFVVTSNPNARRSPSAK